MYECMYVYECLSVCTRACKCYANRNYFLFLCFFSAGTTNTVCYIMQVYILFICCIHSLAYVRYYVLFVTVYNAVGCLKI